MNPHPAITQTAALVADPARAAMLILLLDGRAYPAGELAYAGGVSAQTASSHLAKLLAGGLVIVEAEGRHRYYRLAGPQVADMLEHLAALAPAAPPRRRTLPPEVAKLRLARCCYDHLAGRLGVAVTRAMLERGYLSHVDGKALVVTPIGAEWFRAMGLDIDALRPSRHGLARACLDWTERQHHLAGPLGTRFMALGCANGWFKRAPVSRAVEVTAKGWRELQARLDIAETGLRD
jgi:DNA-binding transcriptional ArsR family regulator